MVPSKFIFLGVASLSLLAASPLAAETLTPADTKPPVEMPKSVETKVPDEAVVKIVENPTVGNILTDSKGMTLYYFTDDKGKESVCYDECAALWPPFVIKEDLQASQNLNGRLGVIDRRDHTRQVTFDGKPLYFYVKDTQPGDLKGRHLDNKWFLIHLDK